jgi:hypothetical protein
LEAAAEVYRSLPAVAAAVNMEGAPAGGALYFVPTKHGFRRSRPPGAAAAAR